MTGMNLEPFPEEEWLTGDQSFSAHNMYCSEIEMGREG